MKDQSCLKGMGFTDTSLGSGPSGVLDGPGWPWSMEPKKRNTGKDKAAAQKEELRYAFEEIDFLVAGVDFQTVKKVLLDVPVSVSPKSE